MSVGRVLLAAAILLTGCGGGGGGGGGASSGSGTVTTGLSDPPSCKASLLHVWVTVTDVKAHTKASAESGDAGFIDLTPMLASGPMQIDLLSAATTECLLATLGSTSGLPPGTYQQVRVLLVANDATGISLATNGGTNECAAVNAFNCVVDSSNTMHPLSLPSEAKTGIKIPPGQLGGGGLTIATGKGLDIDIDFNACASVVQAGNSGKYILKPTLRAGELGLNPLIAGDVVAGSLSDSSVIVPVSNMQPTSNAIVWLEQQSHATPIEGTGQSETIENYIASATTDSNGHFEFCPVAAGNYEIVADAAAMPGSETSSNATVTTGVSVSSSGGPNNLVIPLVAEDSGPGTVQGVFSTANSSSSIVDDISFSALQQFSTGGQTVQALIPFFTANGAVATTPATTTTGPSPGTNCSLSPAGCAGNTHCACFIYTAPNSQIVVGAASSTGGGYTMQTAGSPAGSVDALATQEGSSMSVQVCSPSELATQAFTLMAAPQISNAGTLAFSGCD